MAGHSKWATTKHRKAAQDKKRAALFSKLSRNISIAARTGGDPNPDNNASLAAAIAKARSYSFPKDKIDAAIADAFKIAGGDDYEEVVYEGYGPFATPIYVEALTDNRNRTAADIRRAFARAGGRLGPSGSVAFQFERRGNIFLEPDVGMTEDDLMILAAEAGAQDVIFGQDEWIVVTSPGEVALAKSSLEASGLRVRDAYLVMEPTSEMALSLPEAMSVLGLVNALEELDDVESVYHSLALTDDISAAFQ